jgi:hypothetical protein
LDYIVAIHAILIELSGLYGTHLYRSETTHPNGRYREH